MMFWQKIKSVAQWFIRKITVGLRWLGIKLGIIPVIDTSVPKRFIPGQVLPYKRLPGAVLFNISTFLHYKDFASNNRVLGYRLYPKKALEKKLKESVNKHSMPSAMQAVPGLAVPEEKKNEANSFSELGHFLIHNNLTKLLKAVEYADYEQVEQIIADDPALMFGYVNYEFRDGSRECISPLKCAFKLYDTYMWKIFYERIRRDVNPDLRQKYVKQMQEQTTHIDLEPLFEAYTEYERQCQRLLNAEITDEKLAEEWFKLGTVQKRMLPIHMLKEFSREGRRWHENTSFDVNITPRPANCCLFDYIANAWKSLSSTLSDPGWGVSFSLISAARGSFLLSCGGLHLLVCARDLAGFRRLFEVRREDLARQPALIAQNSLASQEQKNQSAVAANSSRVAP